VLYESHIFCLRITEHLKYFTQHMTKIYTTYEKILDIIYEFFEQHMTNLTLHVTIFYTTYDKIYTTYDNLKIIQHIRNS